MLTLKIVTPERVVYNGEIDSVKVPGEQGEFEILIDHAALISTLIDGVVTYVVKGEAKTLEVKGGFVEVSNNSVSLCVEV